MIRYTAIAAPWIIRCWSERAREDLSYEDDWLVDQNRSRTRLAVIDGVTFTAQTAATNPADLRAAAPAAEVRATLKSSLSIADCLAAANETLYSRGVQAPVSRDIAQATCAAADLFGPGGEGVIVRAGDCSAWARRDGRWQECFPFDVHTSEFRDLAAVAYRAAGQTLEEHLEVSRRLPDGPRYWRSAPVGRLAELVAESYTLSKVDELVLASDGAMLETAMLQNIEEAITDAPSRQRDLTKGGDDYTVLWARRRPT